MENNAALINESGISITSILLTVAVCAVIVGGIIYYQQKKTKSKRKSFKKRCYKTIKFK